MVALVEADRPIAEIAIALSISEPTLRSHYGAELAAQRPQITFPFAEPETPKRRPARPRAGRPEHVPTEETREQVSILLAGGLAAWQIAVAIGISEPTLRERYAEELASGRARMTAKVVLAMYSNAVEGKNVAAQKAFLTLGATPPPAEGAEQPAEPLAESIGKKAAAQIAAHGAASGAFAPPPPPRLVVNNDG